MALELRRPVRIGAGFGFVPSKDMPDDMWANYISYIIARIINFCFDRTNNIPLEEKPDLWQALHAEVLEWRSSRPASFNTFSTTPKFGNIFPSHWMVRPWHGKYHLANLSKNMLIFVIRIVAGEQYCSVAEILLAQSKPHPDIPQFRNLNLDQDQEIIQDSSLRVCGLAFTNENIATRVNAFGPLAFCMTPKLT
jgi:hypothetical protein